MEKNKSFRELLGITQEELSIILKVTRSQLSMYELGKRDLPIVAKLILSELLLHAQNSELKSEIEMPNKKRDDLKVKYVNDILLINQHKQLIIDKKLELYLRKEKNNMASQNLTEYLKNKNTETAKKDFQIGTLLEKKALTINKKEHWQTQFKLQIKKELLEAEEKQLKSILQKLG